MTINWGEYGFRVTSPYGYRSDPFNGGTEYFIQTLILLRAIKLLSVLS
ncbi:hypothetical protein [Paenibacillus alvei]|nr:hypothetical protein [Paenibacillus alvei]MCY7488101.1 hypothetical protein [Paenibacillus alvei]